VFIDPAFEGPAVTYMIFSHQITLERTARMSAFNDLEANLRHALDDEGAVHDWVLPAKNLLGREGTLVNSILWKAAIEALPPLEDIIMSSPDTPFDFCFINNINDRTCLHEASIAGELRLVDLSKGVEVERADVYGRPALHHTSMNGHATVC
jgi:CDK inhibitor PHO81